MSYLNFPRWSARQWTLFLVFAGPLLLVLPSNFTELSLEKSLLWLTGVVLLVYTVETQGLRFEMIRQNEIAVEPVIIATAQVKEVQGIAPIARNTLFLKNIGKGPALYITVDDAILTRTLGSNWQVSFIGRIDVIEPEEEIEISPTLPREENTSKVR